MLHLLTDLINHTKNPGIIGNIVKGRITELKNSLKKTSNSYVDFLTLKQEYHAEKPPRPSSHYGARIYFKHISPEEWALGKIKPRTLNKIIAAMAGDKKVQEEALSSINEKMKLPATDDVRKAQELSKKEITDKLGQMNIRPVTDIEKFIKKTGSKLLKRRVEKRSKVTPVKVGASIIDRAYVDFINGEPQGKYNIVNGEESLSALTAMIDESMFVIYKGEDRKNKTSRAVVRLVRKFARSKLKSAINNPPTQDIAVFDIVGPKRQQQQIMACAYKIANDAGKSLYVPEELKNRFKFLFKFEEKPTKIITQKVNTLETGAKLSAYSSMSRYCSKAVWSAISYCVIPKTYKVLSCTSSPEKKVDEKDAASAE